MNRAKELKLILVSEASRKFGVGRTTWNTAIRRGYVTSPVHKINDSYYYTEEEAAEIAAEIISHQRQPGEISCSEAAKLYGVTQATISKFCIRHDIGRKPCLRRRWLSPDDVGRLRNYLD